jgi:hypothetical protein
MKKLLTIITLAITLPSVHAGDYQKVLIINHLDPTAERDAWRQARKEHSERARNRFSQQKQAGTAAMSPGQALSSRRWPSAESDQCLSAIYRLEPKGLFLAPKRGSSYF